LLALLTFIVGNITALISTNLFVHIIGRGIAGFGAGLYLPLAIATAAEMVEPSARGRALSLAWGSNAAGAVIGIPIGLWLAEQTNWRVSVGMILFLSLIAFVGLLFSNLNLKVTAPPSLREQAGLLIDRRVMSVIGITLLAATSGFGLYVYTAPILADTPNAPAFALSLWNVGGLIGSLGIGYFVDRIGKPQWVMVGILCILLVMYLLIPALSPIPLLGLIPFLVWGAMGWSTMTPQQYRLSEIKPGHETALVALNSSAVSLGGVGGAALGGLAIESGLDPKTLPYVAAVLVLCALVWQLKLIRRPIPKLKFT
jgi:predicted MFS family arabinose efflux permease